MGKDLEVAGGGDGSKMKDTKGGARDSGGDEGAKGRRKVKGVKGGSPGDGDGSGSRGSTKVGGVELPGTCDGHERDAMWCMLQGRRSALMSLAR